jgi:aspartyl-tRNA(Asn)/glutamyl-tRNA(Gln) amidotransferase subunit C
MDLSPQQVEHIADLARLNLSEDEKERYAEELSVVLDYMEKLEDVKTDGVEPTAQVTGLKNKTRADEPQDISDEKRKDILDEFPQQDGDMLKVKSVFDN